MDDKTLLECYKQSKSVKKKINELVKILKKYDINNEELLIELIPLIIPAGLKGVVRGLKFNEMVKCYLDTLYSDVKYEINVSGLPERPDWTITRNNKTLVGYNQIDLWSGGAQTNRANKYIYDDSFHSKYDNIKIISVIYSKPEKETRSITKLMNYRGKRLAYIEDLPNIINEYFT